MPLETSVGHVPMERLRTIFDGVFDGVFVGQDGRTTYANEAGIAGLAALGLVWRRRRDAARRAAGTRTLMDMAWFLQRA